MSIVHPDKSRFFPREGRLVARKLTDYRLGPYAARATLIPVPPQHTLTRSYWTVVHEDLRIIRRIGTVAEFLAGIVRRDSAIV